jgi:hypothetical protein
MQLKAMLKAILALSIEVRIGRLPKDELGRLKSNRWTRYFDRDKEKHKTPLELCEERYQGIDLRPPSLDPDLVTTLLTRGYVDAAEVQASLDSAPPFISPSAEPTWHRAWHGYESTEAEYAAAMAALEADFAALKYVEPHVVMHVFGILLHAARIGFGNRTLAQTKVACKAYVDNLAASKKLDLPSARPRPLQTDSGYQGLGFIEEETAEFRELRAYFDTVIDKAWRATLPTTASELFNLFKKSPEEFIRRITLNSSPTPVTFWDVPLLHLIAPVAFAQALISLDPAAQVTLIQSLSSRYERRDTDEVRTLELPWLAKVYRALRAALPNLGPMSRYRLRTAAARHLEPLLPSPPKPAKRASKVKPRPNVRPKPPPKS